MLSAQTPAAMCCWQRAWCSRISFESNFIIGWVEVMDNMPFILLHGKVCARVFLGFFSEWKQIERRVHGDKDGSLDTLSFPGSVDAAGHPHSLFAALSRYLLTVCWQFLVNTQWPLGRTVQSPCSHLRPLNRVFPLNEKIAAQTQMAFTFPLFLQLRSRRSALIFEGVQNNDSWGIVASEAGYLVVICSFL